MGLSVIKLRYGNTFLAFPVFPQPVKFYKRMFG
jgi:hypothetical protein